MQLRQCLKPSSLLHAMKTWSRLAATSWESLEISSLVIQDQGEEITTLIIPPSQTTTGVADFLPAFVGSFSPYIQTGGDVLAQGQVTLLL